MEGPAAVTWWPARRRKRKQGEPVTYAEASEGNRVNEREAR
jgi:hypothetical protein